MATIRPVVEELTPSHVLSSADRAPRGRPLGDVLGETEHGFLTLPLTPTDRTRLEGLAASGLSEEIRQALKHDIVRVDARHMVGKAPATQVIVGYWIEYDIEEAALLGLRDDARG